MPPARTGLDRQVKMDEILDAAQARLTEGGFEALSVAGIARELGVAQNSVYWYFRSKDELFAAAFRRLLTRLVAKKPPAGANRIDRVLWVTDQMADLASLRADLRDRAAHSQAARELALELDGWVRQLLIGSGRPDDVGEVFLAAVDGILASPRPRSDRRRLVTVAFDQVLGSSRVPAQVSRRSEPSTRVVAGHLVADEARVP